jgi:hypothetical protein
MNARHLLLCCDLALVSQHLPTPQIPVPAVNRFRCGQLRLRLPRLHLVHSAAQKEHLGERLAVPRQERVVAGRERADRGAQAFVLGSHGGDTLVAAAPDKARNLAVKGRLAVAAVTDRLEQPLQRLCGKGAPLLDQRRRLVKVLRDRPADRCVRYRRLQ